MAKDNRSLTFIWINVIALTYAAVSFYLGQGWLHDLTRLTGSYTFSLFIVLFIAIIPGYLNTSLLASLFLYKYQPVHLEDSQFPPINVLIAAYNEEDSVMEMVRGLKNQDYPNTFDILVMDDGSKDNTVERLNKIKPQNMQVIPV